MMTELSSGGCGSSSATRVGLEADRTVVPFGAGVRRGSARIWLAGALALLLLIGTGVAYRAAASGLRAILDNPVELPVPLSDIPSQIDGWLGEELAIQTTTREYMETNFADDYISRRYVNTAEGIWADVYVVYCSLRPSGLLGHKPSVCFPAHGWYRDSRTRTEIVLRSGRTIKCMVQQFHKPAPAYQQVFVLSYYVVNGQITLSESDFSGFLDRRPNLSGDPARYVAQVQISSAFEHSSQSAAADLSDAILRFLPDPQGHVEAAPSTGDFATEKGTGGT